jgi:hypothetical protein
VVDRRRIELVEQAEARWAKQPYHAAEGLSPDEAREVVKRGVESARRIAVRQMQAALQRAREAGDQVVGCAVLVVDPRADWSVDEILAVHVRMHKAEGVLFRDALVRAASSCEVPLAAIPEKLLIEHAQKLLTTPVDNLMERITRLGKLVRPPWGKDQKGAALAAMIALHQPRGS